MPRTKPESTETRSEIDRLGDIWNKVVNNHKSNVDEIIFVKSIMDEWFDVYLELLKANLKRRKRGRRWVNVDQEVKDGKK